MKNIFSRGNHICPWWACYSFDNVFRKPFHNAEKILSPYVHPGDTALDIGPGMGYFSITMARLVGDRGSVIAADIQDKMLKALRSRSQKAGLGDRIITHLAGKDSIRIEKEIDFALAFWMVHEVPNRERFFHEIRAILKPDGLFLLTEPLIHVTGKMFEETTQTAEEAGFVVREKPGIFFCRSLLLQPILTGERGGRPDTGETIISGRETKA